MTSGVKPRKSLEPFLKDEVEFYDHQIEGIRSLINQKNFLLADEMGLGKSLEAIALYCTDISRGMATRALVVCPVSLKENWAEEFGKFTRIPVTVLDGSPKLRQHKIEKFSKESGPRVLVVNYEQVKPHLADLNKCKFDVVIYDEAHYIKSPTSQRTKASLALRGDRNFMLTGTPVLNNVSELWPLLHKIDPVRFPKYWQFVNRYCVYGGFQNKAIIGTKNERELREILSSIMLRRLARDVLPLKEPVPIIKRVSLTPTQRELYDQAKDDLVVVDHETGEEQDIDNALTKFLRLKQICGTTRPFNGVDESGKLDMAQTDAVEIMENGNRLIVFTQFRDVLDAYSTRLQTAGFPTWELTGSVKAEERQGIVREWAASEKPGAIVCMLQVAGVGLNMTAARHIQFLDKLYVPGLNQQAIARANRIGQDITQAVQVFEYICRDTIESRIEAILNGKMVTVRDVVENAASWKRQFLNELKKSMRQDDAAA